MDPNTTAAQPEVEHIAPDAATPQVDPSSGGDWYKSASPDVEHTQPGAAPPQVDAQPQQPQTVPVPVTPLKRGGLLGVIDNVADALVGKTRPELGKDPDGNMYIKQHSLTKGEQWMRIAGEGLVGAAAGLKAGRGHGMGAAGIGGVEAGEHLQDREKQGLNDQIGQEDKIMLSNANHQMLRMNLAENAWKAARLGVEASQHDIEFSQKQEDRLVKDGGGTVLGTVAHPGDLSHILKINPDLASDLVKNHQIELVKHYDDEGKVAGFKVIKMPDANFRAKMLPAGAVFHTFDPLNHTYVEHHASDPMSVGDVQDYDTAASNEETKWQNTQAEQKLKGAQTQKDLGDATKVPSEIEANQTKSQLNRAEAGEVPSKIAKNDAEAAKATAEGQKAAADSGEGPQGDALVDAIGTGHVDTGRLAYLASRNPALLEKVVSKYPGFDNSKVGGYAKMYLDYTSGKTSKALNSGSTALLHLRELSNLNTVASHIPGTPAYNAYMNKVDTVSEELAQFYGSPTLPTIAGIKKTLAKTLPGNRDAAIREQARSMGDKFNEYQAGWDRGVPSDAYKPLMPQLSEASKEARAFLDPKYKKQLVEEHQKQAAKPAAPPKAATIGEPVIEQPLAPARPNAAAAAPKAFSVSAWLRANPGGDAEAAKAAATAQKMQVID